MKASAVPLQAELMREHRAQTDVCGMCKLGVPEHQQHMMMECTAYEEERKKMEAGIATGDALSAEEARALLEVGRSARATFPQRWTAELLSNPGCDAHVRAFLDSAFTKRDKVLRPAVAA
jgi:hypothetical protein